MDRHDLYELCVQSPAHLVPMLRAVHGGGPRVLAEDFCGTALLSREWVRMVPGARAVATDKDPEVLRRAREAGRALGDRLRLVCADLLGPGVAAGPDELADVLFIGNFSIGEVHERRGLVEYLGRCRARLREGGVVVCDTYGGESAYRLGAVTRAHAVPGRAGMRVHYTWQQRRADPFTGEVECALHFRVEEAGEIVQEEFDAFVYRWRLWSVPELREAMREAGFGRTEVRARLPGAGAAAEARDVGRSFIVCVAARTG